MTESDVKPLGSLRETSAAAPRDALIEELREHGYVFMKSALPPEAVIDVRRTVLDALGKLGWLTPDSDLEDARPSERARREEVAADLQFIEAYRAIQALQPFHELAHHPALVRAMRSMLGTPLLVHPRKILRAGLPQDDLVAPAHQDYPLIQGTPDVLTTWIPLGDCPDERGGLRVLAGSHHAGLRAVMANSKIGGLEVDDDKISTAGDWLTADFRAGDALVFHSFTVHAAKRNRSDRLRLSVDFRYQSAAEPVLQASLEPHYYPIVPGYDDLCRDWTSRDAVSTPDGVHVVPEFDPFVGPDQVVTSRLVAPA